VDLSGVYAEADATKDFPVADTGVKIIYLEHETSD
jgi:hypothetical protein